MNHRQILERAIDYIETHLTEDITYADAAAHVHLSQYYFHRLFSMTTDLTVSEYIRKRRLTEAAQELIAADAKVIDIALKYGYESPTSFTKAFTRFHGIPPHLVRHTGDLPNAQARLSLPAITKGGFTMAHRIIKSQPFQLLAKVRKFRNESISEPDNTEIPDFWSECHADSEFCALHAGNADRDLYGVCAPISKDSDCFEYGIGMRCSGGPVPAGYRLWTIQPTLWAVFDCIGSDKSCIGDTWDHIFRNFLPQGEYTMLDDADFELYPANPRPGLFCEIWIPVKKA